MADECRHGLAVGNDDSTTKTTCNAAQLGRSHSIVEKEVLVIEDADTICSGGARRSLVINSWLPDELGGASP
jgi:hypothetical protein